MQRKYSRLFLAVTVFSIFIWGCTKIDTTVLGADLIPAVDNVHTFADTLEVIGTQHILPAGTDTVRIGASDINVLGSINNDPIFGKTSANIYLQFKPTFFPYYFGNPKDSINQPYAPGDAGFDSVVLCLSYQGFYGDSAKPQHLRVLEMVDDSTQFRWDSIYTTDYNPINAPSNVLGDVTIIPTDLAKYTYYRNRKDSSVYQIRIPLNTSFLTKLLANSDSSAGKPFYSDSVFKSVFKGFAIEADGGSQANGLFYISLSDANTRLEVHYRRKNVTLDTAFSSLPVVAATSTAITKSATANRLVRDRSGSQFTTPAADELYIQATPGTYATLQIPELSLLDNRIIHRAEIVIEQIPPMVPLLPAPNFLYLDVIDTTSGTTTNYKPLPYDLSPNSYYNPNTSAQPFYPTSGIDFSYFGGNALTKTDPVTNTTINYYTFNISRYVQEIVTKRTINYGLRLTAPYDLYYYGYSLPFNNRLASGGIKIGNGNNANYKMRMRIIYSKI